MNASEGANNNLISRKPSQSEEWVGAWADREGHEGTFCVGMNALNLIKGMEYMGKWIFQTLSNSTVKFCALHLYINA